MSLKEKVCQMFILRPESPVCPDNPQSTEVTQLSEEMVVFFRNYPAGGFCLYTKNIINPEQLTEFTKALHSLSPSPLLCIDEEGGRVARIANNEVFGLTKKGLEIAEGLGMPARTFKRWLNTSLFKRISYGFYEKKYR